MTVIKLRGVDRLIPKLVYRIEKLGLKLRSKRILRFGNRLIRYIGIKYGAPRGRRWLMGTNYIEF